MLATAAQKGDLDAIAALLDASADPGEPMLHWVVRVPRIPTVIPVLVDSGADPNAKDGHGFTPRHWAASTGHLDYHELIGPDASPCSPLSAGMNLVVH